MTGHRHNKQTCAAFGCKRWSRRFPANWSFLCRDHWNMVPSKLRKLHSRSLRRAKRYDSPDMWAREARIWRKCIEAANQNVGLV